MIWDERLTQRGAEHVPQRGASERPTEPVENVLHRVDLEVQPDG